MTPLTVRVGRTMDRCHVLGPGVRAVVWVAGCPLRCKECIAPEFLDGRAGQDVSVTALATWMTSIAGIEGVTVSGGEPFEQAKALCALLDLVRDVSPRLSAVAFTGYTVRRLHKSGSWHQKELLRRLDMVIDGPYLPDQHSTKRWRGSENQHIHVLSDRYSGALGDLDESAGVEVLVEADGAFALAGVPPTPGFRPALEAGLQDNGVIAVTKEDA